MNHPYKKFENTNLWNIIQKCINNLVDNQDLELTTKAENVIGYICKSIDEKKLNIQEEEQIIHKKK